MVYLGGPADGGVDDVLGYSAPGTVACFETTVEQHFGALSPMAIARRVVDTQRSLDNIGVSRSNPLRPIVQGCPGVPAIVLVDLSACGLVKKVICEVSRSSVLKRSLPTACGKVGFGELTLPPPQDERPERDPNVDLS